MSPTHAAVDCSAAVQVVEPDVFGQVESVDVAFATARLDDGSIVILPKGKSRLAAKGGGINPNNYGDNRTGVVPFPKPGSPVQMQLSTDRTEATLWAPLPD